MSRVVVMGLGRFGGGLAAARFFAERGDDVLVTDTKPPEALGPGLDALAGLGVALRLGGHDEEDFRAADVVVVNPAVPFDHPLVALAAEAGAALVTEMGLTLGSLRGPVVAVTGTNGKSTTASLIAAMLRASDVPCELGGNIGTSLLNRAADLDASTVAVLEISSFQLQWLEAPELLCPAVGVVTNVSGDHLDRHKTFEHYAAAKRRLVDAVPEGGLVVLREDDPVCREFARSARGTVQWFSEHRVPPVSLDALRLAGRHNRANAAAAAHAALAAGATVEGCELAVRDFTPLPHRLERLGEARGILRVDDSVSTTPEATAAAVHAFGRPVVLLTGGRDKGLDWGPLVAAAGSARVVVAYGETGPALGRALPGAVLQPGFDAAVRCGLELARPGDVLLLSPGFASYDEFAGFDQRGDRFRQLVAETPASLTAADGAR